MEIKIRRWRWWTVALRGLAALVFGALALAQPGAAVLSLVIVFGVFAICDGVLSLALATRAVEPTGMFVTRGLVSILVGILAVSWPGPTALVALLMIGAWAVAAGALEVWLAIKLHHTIQGEGLLALEGLLSVAFGIFMLMSPLAGGIALGLWVGTFAILLGAVLLGSAFRLRGFLRAHPELSATAA